MDEPFQRRLRPAAGRHVASVFSQPPACIERRAQGHHRDAPQQGFEPQERGHGPNRVDLAQQGHRVGVVEDKIGVACVGRTFAQARFDIGVGFVEDHGIRVGGTGGGQQGRVAAHGVCAREDRSVIFHLTGHKDAASRWQIGRGAAKVVFAQPRAGEPVDQRAGAGQLIGAQLGAFFDPFLQTAWPLGVVVDAQIIADQRQGWDQFGPQPA